jgi:hypothetical protein
MPYSLVSVLQKKIPSWVIAGLRPSHRNQQEQNTSLVPKMAEPLIFSHLSCDCKDLKAIYCISSYFLRSCMARRHADALWVGDEEKWLGVFVRQNDLLAKFL